MHERRVPVKGDRYRVWIDDWEPDEAVWIIGVDPAEGYPQDGDRVHHVAFWNLDHAGDAAVIMADHCEGRFDSWEWTWPITFHVLAPDGVIHQVEVDREITYRYRRTNPRQFGA